jgi:nicotinate-nucleotide--dimethylbenzimidazole phosphoribosyltransferase
VTGEDFPQLQSTLQKIVAVSPDGIAAHQRHLDTLTKPIGSLGELETLAARMVAALGKAPELPLHKAVYVFAADHGIVAEGVSAYPQVVTEQMVLNFLRGGAAINVLCRAHNAELTVVDVGVCADFAPADGLLQRKVRQGSRNMLHEAAMSEAELQAAMSVGFEIADAAASTAVTLLAAGEMGIGNTTSASAITAMLTGREVTAVTGKGTGLSTQGTAHKAAVIAACLERHGQSPSAKEPLEILRSLGGLEIAAIAGMILRAASLRIPILLDGFIVTAAAAVAVALEKNVRGYLIAGHCSEEPGHRSLLDFLELQPLISLNMRLGEGSGAALAMPLVEAALRLSAEMATFASAGVSEAGA